MFLDRKCLFILLVIATNHTTKPSIQRRREEYF